MLRTSRGPTDLTKARGGGETSRDLPNVPEEAPERRKGPALVEVKEADTSSTNISAPSKNTTINEERAAQIQAQYETALAAWKARALARKAADPERQAQIETRMKELADARRICNVKSSDTKLESPAGRDLLTRAEAYSSMGKQGTGRETRI